MLGSSAGCGSVLPRKEEESRKSDIMRHSHPRFQVDNDPSRRPSARRSRERGFVRSLTDFPLKETPVLEMIFRFLLPLPVGAMMAFFPLGMLQNATRRTGGETGAKQAARK